MELKIVKYSIDDFVIDLKEASGVLNRLCSKRSIKWQVTGIIQQSDVIVIALDQCESLSADYFFAEINKTSVESIEEEIKSHWQSNIYLMGTIKLTDREYVGLFRREH